MKFLHTMFRVKNLEQSLDFFINKLGLIETRRKEFPQGKFTLVFLSTNLTEPEIELTYNWDSTEDYLSSRSFGHIAFEVDDIYQTCEKLMSAGIIINRPPRDGHMAFIKSPDNQSIELIQKGLALPPKAPWNQMENTSSW